MIDAHKFLMFENRLVKVFKHKSKLARRQKVSCYRVYEHDLPEFPLCIELYDDKVYVAEYLRRHGMDEATHEEWLHQCLSVIAKVLGVAEEDIFVRIRKKMSHRESGAQYEKQEIRNHVFWVNENNLLFKVNLTDYLDTGLFLDHRITRKMVMDESMSKEVLNLFCYTGSFSVYAAMGGANKVVSVDLSNTYLAWAEENFKRNKLNNPRRYHFVQADVKAYLKTLPASTFDIIVMDPPTFSNSKRMKDFLEIQRDHVVLINDALAALKPNGVLYFSTNYTKFVLEEDKLHCTMVKDITKLTTPFDFEGKLQRWCYKITK